MTEAHYPVHPETDLVIDREVPLSIDELWDAWTVPERVCEWFCPRPWRTTSCSITLHPGGGFVTTMASPEGQEHPNDAACFLDVVPGQRLAWTTAMGPGYMPLPPPPEGAFHFTCLVSMQPLQPGADGPRSHYRVIARHCDTETRASHADMGFHDGWGAALDQLIEAAQARRVRQAAPEAPPAQAPAPPAEQAQPTPPDQAAGSVPHASEQAQSAAPIHQPVAQPHGPAPSVPVPAHPPAVPAPVAPVVAPSPPPAPLAPVVGAPAPPAAQEPAEPHPQPAAEEHHQESSGADRPSPPENA